MEAVAEVRFNALYERWKSIGFVRNHWGNYDHPDTFAYGHRERDVLTRAFSWAIPSDEAIAWIVERCPRIVEIGAGRGYWAALLSQAGADVVAYDCAVVDGAMGVNNWHQAGEEASEPTLWFPVQTGGPLNAANHPDRTLFLCWPPYDTPMAADCLKAYQGDTVLYVGEGWGGCTGDEAFFETLESQWEEIGEMSLPQWPAIRDHLWLYQRKEKRDEGI